MRSRRYAFILVIVLSIVPLQAADDFAGLATEIGQANRTGSGAITLDADIILTRALPAITGEITIDGNGHTISGGQLFRIFDVDGGSLTLANVTLQDGKAESGGAILMRNASSLIIETSTFAGNIAETSGGAILAMGGSLQISDSRFENNCAQSATYTLIENGEDSDSLRTDAQGCEYVNYRRRETGGSVQNAVDGGAIRLIQGAVANIETSTFTANRATYGGAISTASGDARLNIDRSSFHGNLASGSGGAIGSVWSGGGATAISRSSFVKNIAEAGGAIAATKHPLDISNSTFSENSAESGGGALSLGDGASATITHATFVDNRSRHGAAAISQLAGRAYLRNSLISGSGSAEDCIGVWDQNIGNLSLDGSCADRPSDDPRLGELTGSPAFYPLRDRSQAIDAADAEFCLEYDQVGTARPQGGGCDIGAIEERSAIAAEPTPVPPVVCTLAHQIIAANRDLPSGGCPAGNGADTIVIERDIRLFEALPVISSHITIEGDGHSIDGDRRHRIFDVDGGMLTVKNLILMNGRGSTEDGGAIRLSNGGRARVQDSQFIGNHAEYGGAVFIGWVGADTSWLDVSASHFVDNGNSAIYAGSGRVTVSKSSFSRNWGGAGAAIGIVNPIRLDVRNSSFIGNSLAAIGMENGVNATLTHLTFHGPAITMPGASWALASNVSLRNSVIAGAAFSQCDKLKQNVGNFIEDGACGSVLTGDALLEDPAGSALFLSPLPGSPLIRAAHANFCSESDQIGNARAISGRCDIGAIEAVPVARQLADCRVTPTHVLNLRDAPEGGIIGGVRQNVTLQVVARTPGWFQVEQAGETGWISADYVTAEGDCA